MVARVRTIIDEVSTTNPFYSATEIYASLTAGQSNLIQHLVMVWSSQNKINGTELFETLKPLVDTDYNVVAGTASSFSLPAGFIKDIAVKAGTISTGLVPCRKRTNYARGQFLKNNTYGVADNTNTRFYSIFSNTSIEFDSPLTITTQAWSIDYIKQPEAISVSIQPTLVAGHEEIVQYACYDLLKKDRQMELAIQCYGAYAQNLQSLYY